MAARSGGRILVDQLRVHGTQHVYGVPGESYLALLDALHDVPELKFFVCRQEGGAAMMAEADAKLTGRPGVCIVTRGPGATNASAGIHIAHQDSTPLVLLVGQVARSMMGREAFQEIDFRHMYGPLSKWVTQIDDPARIPEMMARAFSIASSGRPGPVVLALPEDMLTETSDVRDAEPVRTSQAYPDPKSIRAFSEILQASEHPMLIVGGGGWDTTAVENLKIFAERTKIPIVTSFRRQDYFDNTHSSFAGYLGIGVNPKLAQRVQDADLLIVLGARLSEVPTSGYSLLKIPVPDQSLVHVHADPEELGRVYQAELPINADPRAMAAVLQDVSVGDGARRWADWLKGANNDCQTYSRPVQTPGNLQMSEVMAHLQKVLPENAIITNGAGNYTAWIHRFYRYRQYGTQLAPTAGSMGYGVPASVAAKLRMPEREVIAFAGDGCFLMNGQEFATAVQYGANIICIVVNNSMLGTIRMHQERHYPGRVSNTGLINPDFASYAKAFGGYGEIVERTEEFPAALQRARDSAKPAILELRVDPEALTPGKSLSEIRGSSL